MRIVIVKANNLASAAGEKLIHMILNHADDYFCMNANTPYRLVRGVWSERLHHAARTGAHLAVFLVHDGFVDGGEADKDVDDHRNLTRAENHLNQVPTERHEEPVQPADNQQDEGDHVKNLHELNWIALLKSTH
jgi:hypothetical protein